MERVLRKLDDGFLDGVDVASLVKECARFETGVSRKKASRFSLAVLRTPGLSKEGYDIEWNTEKELENGVCYPIYMDTPIALGLMFDGRPAARSGFVPADGDGGRALMIYNLMGVLGRIYDKTSGFVKKNIHTGSIYTLDWEKLLVRSVKRLGGELGFDEVAIRSAYNNPVIGKYHEEDTPYLEIGRALKKYDAVAERLGFAQKADRNWYMKI